jgi:ABC-type glycerol-3-phosphate transport system substrate-binding protein
MVRSALSIDAMKGALHSSRCRSIQQHLRSAWEKKKGRHQLWIPIVLLLLLGSSWSVCEVWAKTEIHFWHAMSGQLNDAVEALAKKFNERQSDYEVKPLGKGTYPETLTAAITAYRSKTPPHIVQIFDVGTQTMLLSGAIMPVFQMMREQGLVIDWSDFIQPVLSYYSKEGQLYSMPFNSSTPILYYNKDAFQKAGLSSDRPPITWKEVPPSVVLAQDGRRGSCLRIWPPGMTSPSLPTRTASAASTPNS